MDLPTAQTVALVLANALAVFLVAKLFPGVRIQGFLPSILVAIIYGVLNWLLWWPIAVLQLPLAVVTFGLSLVFINGLLLLLTAKVVPGFEVSGCLSATFASIGIAVLTVLFRGLLMPKDIPIFYR